MEVELSARPAGPAAPMGQADPPAQGARLEMQQPMVPAPGGGCGECGSPAPPQLLVHLALMGGQTINGVASVVAKVGLPQMNPIFFALLREACASPLLLAMSLAIDGRPALSLRDVPLLAFAVVSLFVNQIFYTTGLKLANPVMGAAWQPSQPIFVLFIAVLLRWEVFSWGKLGGVLCALGGGLLMTLGGAEHGGSGAGDSEVAGNILFFLNCLGTATFVLAMRALTRRMRSYTALAVVYVGATAGIACVALAVSGSESMRRFFCPDCQHGFWEFPTGAIFALAYWVLGSSVTAYAALTFGAKHARDPTHCLAYTALQPVVAGTVEATLVAAGWNETHHGNQSLQLPQPAQVLGALIILAGVACIVLDAWRFRPPAPREEGDE